MRKIVLAALALSACQLSLRPTALAAPPALGPETQNGLDLRRKYAADTAMGARFIHIYSFAMHHTSQRCSILLRPNAQRQWTMSVICEEGPGLLRIEPKKIFDLTRQLTPQQSTELERKIADKATYRQPHHAPPPPPPAIGARLDTIELVTPGRHHTGNHFAGAPATAYDELGEWIVALAR